jgi:hypothetical protein
LEFTKLPIVFDCWTFENFFITDLADRLVQESQQFDFFKIEKDRTSRPDRIWMHQYNIHSFQETVQLFTSKWLKQKFSELTGVDYTQQQARIELCKDATGSWLEEHCDDPAKTFTCQIYLSDAPSSTKLGTIGSQAKYNCGWVFANTGTEPHGLPPLEFDRTSIILNYVNNDWRNRDVLV